MTARIKIARSSRGHRPHVQWEWESEWEREWDRSSTRRVFKKLHFVDDLSHKSSTELRKSGLGASNICGAWMRSKGKIGPASKFSKLFTDEFWETPLNSSKRWRTTHGESEHVFGWPADSHSLLDKDEAQGTLFRWADAPRSEDASQVIGRLCRGRASIVVRMRDVSNPGELSAVINQAVHGLPPLKGIVHSAGTLEDGLLV